MTDLVDQLIEERTAAREAAARVADRVTYQPLTYRQDATDERGNGVSYFADRILAPKGNHAAQARLQRHAQEMDAVRTQELAKAARAVDNGDLEYRVNPDLTAGTGGEFIPPLWLIADAANLSAPGRVLAKMARHFRLPPGCQSVSVPRITTGTSSADVPPDSTDDDTDALTASTTSQVVTIASQADIAMQLFEQSPVGAHTDEGFMQDLHEAYDSQLEAQLIAGTGGTGPTAQLQGITTLSGINSPTFTNAAPTGSLMYPYFGQAAAEIGDNRKLPPEAWLMRTARWAWLLSSEDAQSRPLENPTLMGADNPAVPGSLLGWPVWLDDAIPANQGTGANQDVVIACRPSDLFLLEASPVTHANVEVLSGTLEARLIFRNYAAFISGRFPSGISVISGTGMAIVSGF